MIPPQWFLSYSIHLYFRSFCLNLSFHDHSESLISWKIFSFCHQPKWDFTQSGKNSWNGSAYCSGCFRLQFYFQSLKASIFWNAILQNLKFETQVWMKMITKKEIFFLPCVHSQRNTHGWKSWSQICSHHAQGPVFPWDTRFKFWTFQAQLFCLVAH